MEAAKIVASLIFIVIGGLTFIFGARRVRRDIADYKREPEFLRYYTRRLLFAGFFLVFYGLAIAIGTPVAIFAEFPWFGGVAWIAIPASLILSLLLTWRLTRSMDRAHPPKP